MDDLKANSREPGRVPVDPSMVKKKTKKKKTKK